ncbi:MAG: hypothetical protein ACJA2W_003671 [Planctomycetota bacterium]|jgi:hypothetical protein
MRTVDQHHLGTAHRQPSNAGQAAAHRGPAVALVQYDAKAAEWL